MIFSCLLAMLECMLHQTYWVVRCREMMFFSRVFDFIDRMIFRIFWSPFSSHWIEPCTQEMTIFFIIFPCPQHFLHIWSTSSSSHVHIHRWWRDTFHSQRTIYWTSICIQMSLQLAWSLLGTGLYPFMASFWFCWRRIDEVVEFEVSLDQLFRLWYGKELFFEWENNYNSPQQSSPCNLNCKQLFHPFWRVSWWNDLNCSGFKHWNL